MIYKVEMDFEGYSRGTVSYLVKADTPEEALEHWWEGEELERKVIRDDTDKINPRIK